MSERRTAEEIVRERVKAWLVDNDVRENVRSVEVWPRSRHSLPDGNPRDAFGLSLEALIFDCVGRLRGA